MSGTARAGRGGEAFRSGSGEEFQEGRRGGGPFP